MAKSVMKWLIVSLVSLSVGCGDVESEPEETGNQWELNGSDSDSGDGGEEGGNQDGDVDGGDGDVDGGDADVDGGDADVDGGDADVDGGDEDVDGGDADGDGETYQGSEDLFGEGSLNVMTVIVNDGPVPMQAYLPTSGNRYSVLIFHHGFLLANSYYSSLLERVASHGFVVIAPQFYAPGGWPVGKPTTGEEAALAVQVYDWLDAEGGARLDRNLDLSRLGLVGHSRGAKVMYRALASSSREVSAMFGLDPVDGEGGPLGGDPSVMGELTFDGPRFFLGMGLGSAALNAFSPVCAPEGDNYATFYADASSPAYQVIATNFGHLDMLDDDLTGCGLECSACVEGPERASVRAYSAAAMVGFFRDAFFGDSASLESVLDQGSVSIAIDVEQK